MKELSKKDNKPLKEHYDEALRLYLKVKAGEQIVEDSKIETFFNDRITKVENHLASMLGRTGMDTSMVLMGMILFLDKFFAGKFTREQLVDQLRKDGARYFSNAIQRDKEEKKNQQNAVPDSSTK
jgi:hypothetical protein